VYVIRPDHETSWKQHSKSRSLARLLAQPMTVVETVIRVNHEHAHIQAAVSLLPPLCCAPAVLCSCCADAARCSTHLGQ
jgi:hypothetical protein